MTKQEFNKKLNVIGADGFQRLNFLYQASVIVSNEIPNCPQISALYGANMISIGKKLQLKINPSIKRTLCKGCKGLLIPGITAKVSIKTVNLKKKKTRCKRNIKTQVWECFLCKRVRNFILHPGYHLWTEVSNK